jgi:hypothetical protein
MSDYFDRLETELRGAAVRHDAGDGAARRRRPGGRLSGQSWPLLALTAALIVAVPTAAAVVVFQPEREPDNLVRTAPKSLLASGQDPLWGKWEAFASDSTVGPCFGIRLIDPPGTQPGGTSEGCGATSKPARIGGGSGPARTAVFGFAPATARRVRIEAAGQAAREFPTHQTNDRRGAFFFASLPANPNKLPRLRVIALDADRQPIAPSTTR